MSERVELGTQPDLYPKCRGCGQPLEPWEQDPAQGGNTLQLCVPRVRGHSLTSRLEAAAQQGRCMTAFLIWAVSQQVMVDAWLEAGGRATLATLAPVDPDSRQPGESHMSWHQRDEDNNEKWWNERHPNGPRYKRSDRSNCPRCIADLNKPL